MSSSSLTAWLRTRDDQWLVALLLARPDLASPAPADLSVLATRAGIRASIARACDDLDAFTLKVMEALVVADADRQPIPISAVAALCGRGVPAKAVKKAVAVLRERALVWGEDNMLQIAPGASDGVSTFPAGLGQSSPAVAELNLAVVLAELPEPELAVLRTLAGENPTGRTKDAAVVMDLAQARTPVQKLLARGLLLQRNNETVELPREIGLALRGDRPLGPIEVAEPPLRTQPAPQSAVDNSAAGMALELTRHMESLLRLWSEDPPPVLRSGGIGVRELRRLAKELDATEEHAGWLAELAVGAGLVADSQGDEPEWLLTTQADSWLITTTENRWATLALAWLDLPRLPGLIGSKDAKGRAIGALAPELDRPKAAQERRQILEVLAELPAGQGLSDVNTLTAAITWRAPKRSGRIAELVTWTYREGTTLGVLAQGSLSSAARLLLSDGLTAAAKIIAETLPTPVDHVLVQADLTIVAPGPLTPELAEDISLVANVESAGGATVYRVTDHTVRRALDAGRSAAELHELFRTRSRTPVPQSLSYLIDDVARRHGQLRGGTAGCFLRCDDPVLLAEVLGHRISGELDLRRIAPTVVISSLPLPEVLAGLREVGFSPAAEGPDGRILDLRSTGKRIPVRRKDNQRATPPTPSTEQLAGLVQRLRAGDRASVAQRGITVTPTNSAATLTLLQDAATKGQSVWLGFVDSHGSASQLIVTPVSVAAGVVEGFDQAHGEIRKFPVHRVTSVALVEGK